MKKRPKQRETKEFGEKQNRQAERNLKKKKEKETKSSESKARISQL